MATFHNPTEWVEQLQELTKKLSPDQHIPFSTLQEFLAFFNTPIRTWKIPFAVKASEEDNEAVKDEAQNMLREASIAEQVVLQEMRHYLWGSIYKVLAGLQFDKGEVFTIQHSAFQSGDEEAAVDEFPPHTVMFEACMEEEHKFLRIWSVSLPRTPRFVYEDGESFTQYYEFAKLHIAAIDATVHSEDELHQIIMKEKERHNGENYATIAGQRDKDPYSVLYFYWASEFFFCAELALPKGEHFPHLCYNPQLYPFPVQYYPVKNWRKFRYLISQ